MSKSLLALAAGFGGGYLDGQERKRRHAIEDEDLAAKREDRAYTQGERERVKQERMSLADASRPVSVEQPNDVLGDDDGNAMPAVPAYRVGTNRFDTPELAQAAATAANTPEARRTRQAAALDAAGRPQDAIALENAVISQKRSKQQLTSEGAAALKKLTDENAFDTARAMRTGDPAAIAAAFNKSGDWKLQGAPVVTPKERDIPGVGKVTTYDVAVSVMDPSGKVVQKTVNSHDFSMQLMPFEKALELQRKGTATDDKAAYQTGMLDLRGQQVELQGRLAEARVAAAAAKANSGGGPASKEERLRYTSLFSEAGRRMGEAQKALSTLQKDVVFMTQANKPGSPQAQELADLRASLGSYKEERDLYSGMLAGSQTKAPALADAKPKADKGAPAKPASKAEYDKLAPGTKYMHPDGTLRVKG